MCFCVSVQDECKRSVLKLDGCAYLSAHDNDSVTVYLSHVCLHLMAIEIEGF